MTPAAPRTVLLVEDHALTLALVQRSLEADGFIVTAVATARQAIRAFDDVDPDVLVADINLGPGPNGVELATILRAQAPYLGVVFLTNHTSLDPVEGVAPPDNVAFVHKGSVSDPGELRRAIESALSDSGERLVITSQTAADRLSRLSPMQMSVLRQVSEGWSNAEIAQQRGTTTRSVERLVSRTFDALGVGHDDKHSTRVEAARIYCEAFGVPERAASHGGTG